MLDSLRYQYNDVANWKYVVIMTLVEIIVGWYWHKVRRVWPFNIIRYNFCIETLKQPCDNSYSVDCAWDEFKLYSLQKVLLKIFELKQMIIAHHYIYILDFCGCWFGWLSLALCYPPMDSLSSTMRWACYLGHSHLSIVLMPSWIR